MAAVALLAKGFALSSIVSEGSPGPLKSRCCSRILNSPGQRQPLNDEQSGLVNLRNAEFGGSRRNGIAIALRARYNGGFSTMGVLFFS
jgi:hypothetical protein